MGMFDNVKTNAGGTDYLRLKDGDKFKVRVVGEVVVFIDKFGNTKWGNIVWNHTLEKPQAYAYTKTIVNAIKKLEENEDWGDIREYDITVSRTGSAKEDTEYSVTPSPKSIPLTTDQEKACATLDPHKMFNNSISLEAFVNGDEPPSEAKWDNVEPMPGDEDAPVDLNDLPPEWK